MNILYEFSIRKFILISENQKFSFGISNNFQKSIFLPLHIKILVVISLFLKLKNNLLFQLIESKYLILDTNT